MVTMARSHSIRWSKEKLEGLHHAEVGVSSCAAVWQHAVLSGGSAGERAKFRATGTQVATRLRGPHAAGGRKRRQQNGCMDELSR